MANSRLRAPITKITESDELEIQQLQRQLEKEKKELDDLYRFQGCNGIQPIGSGNDNQPQDSILELQQLRRQLISERAELDRLYQDAVDLNQAQTFAHRKAQMDAATSKPRFTDQPPGRVADYPNYNNALNELRREIEALNQENMRIRNMTSSLRKRAVASTGDASVWDVPTSSNRRPETAEQSSAELSRKYDTQLLAHRNMLEEAQGEISRLKRLLQQREAECDVLANKAKDGAALGNEVAQLRRMLDIRTAEAEEARMAAQTFEQRFVSLMKQHDAIVLEKDLEIEQLTRRLVSKEEEVADFAKAKNIQLASFQKELDQFRALANESALLADPRLAHNAEQLIIDLQNQLVQKHSEVVNLQSIVQDQRQQLNEIQKRLLRGQPAAPATESGLQPQPQIIPAPAASLSTQLQMQQDPLDQLSALKMATEQRVPRIAQTLVTAEDLSRWQPIEPQLVAPRPNEIQVPNSDSSQRLELLRRELEAAKMERANAQSTYRL